MDEEMPAHVVCYIGNRQSSKTSCAPWTGVGAKGYSSVSYYNRDLVDLEESRLWCALSIALTFALVPLGEFIERAGIGGYAEEKAGVQGETN